MSWEDIYPFITVNKTDIFQVPSKQLLPPFSHCCCFDCFSYWQSKELLWFLLLVLSLSCRPWIGTACEGVLSAERRNKYHCGRGRVWTWRQWSSLKCLAAYVGSLQVLEYSQILLGCSLMFLQLWCASVFFHSNVFCGLVEILLVVSAWVRFCMLWWVVFQCRESKGSVVWANLDSPSKKIACRKPGQVWLFWLCLLMCFDCVGGSAMLPLIFFLDQCSLSVQNKNY